MRQKKLKSFAKLMSLTFLLSLLVVTNVQAGPTLTSNATGTIDGYNYEYWKDHGNGTMTLNGGGTFSCNWNNIGNILFRTGKSLGSTQTYQQYGNIQLNYACNYQPNGNSYLSVYGWTEGPLVEYYIIESYGTWKPPGSNNPKGTITVDGGTYEIYETTRNQQPSIQGTQTFQQYWSVRTSKRTSGTISVDDHFKAWENMGMQMGRLYEVAMVVEGYQSSGQATMSKMEITLGGSSSNQNPTQTQQPNNGQQTQTSGQPLRDLAQQLRDKGREFYIGCAVPSNFSSSDQNIVKTEFDIITCENDMKIGTISPSQNQFNYSGGDRIVNFAKQNNMKVHGHALVWHKYNPGWVNGTKSMMESYISAVGNHFKGNVYAWDVVNEAVHRDGSFRINSIGSSGQDGASVFGQRQTKQYIEDAFIAAHNADPNAKLVYNDYDLVTRDAKFEGVYEMVKDFKSRNIPIDGVGFQVHLGSDFTEDQARAFGDKIQRLADLGVESYVTEMDVGCVDNSQSGYEKQAETYRWIVEECVKQPYCRAFQVWGIRDSQSWRINPDAPEDRAIAPLIFNDNGQKKPAYYAIQEVLEQAVNGQLSTGSSEVVEGDANGDGTFDSLDFGTLRKILLGMYVDKYDHWEEASDLDKDGSITSIDFGYMRMKLLGMN